MVKAAAPTARTATAAPAITPGAAAPLGPAGLLKRLRQVGDHFLRGRQLLGESLLGRCNSRASRASLVAAAKLDAVACAE